MFERRQEERALAASTLGTSTNAIAGPTTTKSGNVAVIEDDGTLISNANAVDVASSALVFRKKKNKLRAGSSSAGINPDMGDRIIIADDASLEINLLFRLKFYGTKYGRIFLNSDGNLTFEESDFSSTSRSVGRAAAGPPRISPFFADFDPSQTGGTDGVFVLNTAEVLRVTWVNVPRWNQTDSNTFQVSLFPNGRILFAYGQLGAPEGVVGATPGRGKPFEFIDFTTELPVAPSRLGIMERFGTSPEVDDLAIAATFLESFKDIYDHVIVWLDFPFNLGNAFAFELTLKNDIKGIGLSKFDFSDSAGSNGNLESYVQMGALSNYPANPETEFLGTNSTLEVLGQETGHRWGAFLNFIDDKGNRNNDLLGRDLAHWSFFLDSDASVLEGNDLRDNGDGSFTTVESTERFSRLDQYVMGLRPAGQIPDMFYALDQSLTLQAGSAPQEGVTFNSSRVNVSIDQIIAAEGERIPAAADAKKAFKMAFVLLGRQGEPPSQASIDKLNGIRKKWQAFFKKGTDGLGAAPTKLKLK
jgi:hypothetical protein